MMRQAILQAWLASLLLLPLACNSPPVSSRSPAAAPYDHSVERTVRYLASDELEGRGVDTAGIERAANYIAGVYRSIGLEPLPALRGYAQPFDMTVSATISSHTSLTIAGQALALKNDFTPTSFSAEASFDAPVVFAGYGVASDEHDYDDYADVDVNGKVVLAMRFEPHNEKGRSRFDPNDWSEAATLMAKADAADEHGAVALLLVNPPNYHGIDALMPVAPRFKGPRARIPILHITQDAADKLLKPAGKRLKDLQQLIDEHGKPASFPLTDLRAAGDVRLERDTRRVSNVVACLPGSGRYADEYVVVGAHYDHVGRGSIASLSGSKEIHNGADDNASGVAALLEIAERLKNAPPLDRTIIFAAFTAEEWGLIGSQHFVAHPPVTLDKITSMINLDMVGRVRNDTVYIGGYGTAAPLKLIVDAADATSKLQIKTMGAGGLGPSDHMSFALQRIPVLFLFSGLHADYHRPSDDVDKVNFAGIEQVVDFTEQIVRDVADMPRAQYVDASDSFSSSIGSTGVGGSRVRLGVVPDYNAEQEPGGGVRIQGTVPGSPAAEAGLQGGDVIVKFGDSPLTSLYDLSEHLAGAKPGDKVHLTVQRNEQTLELDATLTERAAD